MQSLVGNLTSPITPSLIKELETVFARYNAVEYLHSFLVKSKMVEITGSLAKTRQKLEKVASTQRPQPVSVVFTFTDGGTKNVMLPMATKGAPTRGVAVTTKRPKRSENKNVR